MTTYKLPIVITYKIITRGKNKKARAISFPDITRALFRLCVI